MVILLLWRYSLFSQKGDEIKIYSVSFLSPIVDIPVRRGVILGDWLTRKIMSPWLITLRVPERELGGHTENVRLLVLMAECFKHTPDGLK